MNNTIFRQSLEVIKDLPHSKKQNLSKLFFELKRENDALRKSHSTVIATPLTPDERVARLQTELADVRHELDAERRRANEAEHQAQLHKDDNRRLQAEVADCRQYVNWHSLLRGMIEGIYVVADLENFTVAKIIEHTHRWNRVVNTLLPDNAKKAQWVRKQILHQANNLRDDILRDKVLSYLVDIGIGNEPDEKHNGAEGECETL